MFKLILNEKLELGRKIGQEKSGGVFQGEKLSVMEARIHSASPVRDNFLLWLLLEHGGDFSPSSSL